MGSSPNVSLSLLAEQHSVLMTQVRGLRKALDGGIPIEGLTAQIATLMEHVRLHFAVEEQIMTAHEYPRLAKHRAAHQAFLRKLEELHDRLTDAYDEHVDLLVHLLERWLDKHERNEDEPLLEFLRE